MLKYVYGSVYTLSREKLLVRSRSKPILCAEKKTNRIGSLAKSFHSQLQSERSNLMHPSPSNLDQQSRVAAVLDPDKFLRLDAEAIVDVSR